jgi:hypothetical protein
LAQRHNTRHTRHDTAHTMTHTHTHVSGPCARASGKANEAEPLRTIHRGVPIRSLACELCSFICAEIPKSAVPHAPDK